MGQSRYIAQAGLKLEDLPASTSIVLVLRVCTTIPGWYFYFKVEEIEDQTRLSTSPSLEAGKYLQWHLNLSNGVQSPVTLYCIDSLGPLVWL